MECTLLSQKRKLKITGKSRSMTSDTSCTRDLSVFICQYIDKCSHKHIYPTEHMFLNSSQSENHKTMTQIFKKKYGIMSCNWLNIPVIRFAAEQPVIWDVGINIDRISERNVYSFAIHGNKGYLVVSIHFVISAQFDNLLLLYSMELSKMLSWGLTFISELQFFKHALLYHSCCI